MRASIVAAILFLAACRGEPVPRDYQNAPPDVTHPPATKTDTPSTGATGQALPEPSTGVEGPNPVNAPVTPPAQPTTTTMSDTPPTTTS
jgi:PBP1b-binding outer membrane lipoprotein LpoB